MLLALFLFACGSDPTATAVSELSRFAVGISDSDAGTFLHPAWPDLDVHRARAVVPWDVALRSSTNDRRQKFEAWLSTAIAQDIEPFVVFSGRPNETAPSASEYDRAIRAFLDTYPEVRILGAWNEPNYIKGNGGGLLRDGRPLSDPTCRTVSLAKCGPLLTAFYWRLLRAACEDCTVVAGEFDSSPNDVAYWDAYRRFLRSHRPRVWSFHGHTDANRFQSGGHHCVRGDQRCVTRSFLRWLGSLDDSWDVGHVWDTEVGAYYRDARGDTAAGDTIHGERSQRDATAFILRLMRISPRLTRVYYYNYQEPCTAEDGSCGRRQDRGLTRPASQGGQRRLAFEVIAGR